MSRFRRFPLLRRGDDALVVDPVAHRLFAALHAGILHFFLQPLFGPLH